MCVSILLLSVACFLWPQEDLSLFNNQISEIENLEKLTGLNVLSLGAAGGTHVVVTISRSLGARACRADESTCAER